MKVAVIGAGYVGLVAAACFAESGNDVCCIDVDEKKIARLRAGEVPIFEPGLDRLIEHNCKAKRLRFSTDLAEGVQSSYVIFIAVGTPQDIDGLADLRSVVSVAGQIGAHLNESKIVVLKSTVPVGTADLVGAEIRKHTSIQVEVVSNPEFLKEGAALDDFMRPDRVVLGVSSEKAAKVLEELYSPFVRTGNPILVMDNRSAELTKYAASSMLATRVTFMNEIANLCEAVGADVSHVRRGMGSDRRIGQSFLFPGVGYGGSCFPKDVRALIRTAENSGYKMQIISSVDEVNNRQKERLVQKIVSHFGGTAALRGKTFAVWGLAFKPNTDDMREAPSLTIIEQLHGYGALIRAFDPEAMKVARALVKARGWNVEFVENSYDALPGADASLIVTEWNEFRRPDFERMRSLLAAPVVFDGRNIFEPASMAEYGFAYYSVGRVPVGV